MTNRTVFIIDRPNLSTEDLNQCLKIEYISVME